MSGQSESRKSGSDGISLTGFKSASHGSEFEAYISALETFDHLEQVQELKRLGVERIGWRRIILRNADALP